jgi:nucleoside-diphosphate kinase
MYKNHVLVVVKPGFQELIPVITDKFVNNGYKIVKMTTKRLQLEEAKQLYKIHKKEEFYKPLCEYMSSGPTTAFILYKNTENIFDDFAKIKDKIREEYGQSEMRNVLHSSDSYKNFTHEASVYFYNINQTDLLQK